MKSDIGNKKKFPRNKFRSYGIEKIEANRSNKLGTRGS